MMALLLLKNSATFYISFEKDSAISLSKYYGHIFFSANDLKLFFLLLLVGKIISSDFLFSIHLI